jgi:hypothetical protein
MFKLIQDAWCCHSRVPHDRAPESWVWACAAELARALWRRSRNVLAELVDDGFAHLLRGSRHHPDSGGVQAPKPAVPAQG